MSQVKQYADRDAMALDEAGGYYMRHVMAMTGEQLHGKGDIAAELGWRDMQIAAVQQKLDEVLAEREKFAVQCAAAKIAVKYAKSAGFECTLNTPDVDAFLNEVRADGVEMFASALKEKYAGVAYELIGNYDTNGEEDRISDEGEIQEALHFAAQLRAGSTEGATND